jgi:hypothetical protein
MHVSHETADQVRARLSGVLARAELQVLDGAFAFTEHAPGSVPVAASEGALAMVRDEDGWSVLRPAPDDIAEPLRVFVLHFPPDEDNSGFVGWLASHLKATVGTGVLVVCGFNSRRGGVFDYWCVPDSIGAAAVAEVRHLRASGSSEARRVNVFFYGLFMDVQLLRAKGLDPVNVRPAQVRGVRLRIGHRAALVGDPDSSAYGFLMELTHAELDRLYSDPGVAVYRPEAVVAELGEGTHAAALCYNLPLAPAADERNPEYASKLRELAGRLGLPAQYVDSLS